MKRAVIIILIILFLISLLLAEDKDNEVSRKTAYIPAVGIGLGMMYQSSLNESSDNIFPMGIGLGMMYQISMSLVRNDNYYCLRHYKFDGSLFYSEFNLSETAFLYGKTLNFNTKTAGYLAYSAGLSYITTNANDSDDNIGYIKGNKFGIILDLNFTKGMSRHFGYGFNTTININKVNPWGVIFFNLYSGDFTNNNYKSKRRF